MAPDPAVTVHAQPAEVTPGAAPARPPPATGPGPPVMAAARAPQHKVSGPSSCATTAAAAALPAQPEERRSAKAAFFAACAGLQQQMRTPARPATEQLRFRLEGVLGHDIAVPEALANAVVAGVAGHAQVAPVAVLLIVGLGERWRHHWLSELRKSDYGAQSRGAWYIPAAAWSEDILRAPSVIPVRDIIQLHVTIWCAKAKHPCTALAASASAPSFRPSRSSSRRQQTSMSKKSPLSAICLPCRLV